METLCTLQSVIDTLPQHDDQTAVLALRRGDVAEWSYGLLADHVQRLAAGLAAAGVARGDHVALLADNRPEWIAACLAVLAAGGVAVPLDVHMDEADLGHALRDSGVRRIFTTAAQADRIARFDAAPMPILLDTGEDDERSWRRLLAERSGALPRVAADDRAALFYTSGTTGTPKGVPLTHGNLVFPLNTLVATDLIAADDRVLLPLPLHHVYAFVIGMLLPLALGLPIIFPAALTGPQLVRALQEGQATALLGVPRLYDALYRGIVDRFASRGRAAATLLAAGIGVSAWLRQRLRLQLGALLWRPVRRQVGPRLRVLTSGGALRRELGKIRRHLLAERYEQAKSGAEDLTALWRRYLRHRRCCTRAPAGYATGRHAAGTAAQAVRVRAAVARKAEGAGAVRRE